MKHLLFFFQVILLLKGFFIQLIIHQIEIIKKRKSEIKEIYLDVHVHIYPKHFVLFCLHLQHLHTTLSTQEIISY